MSILASQSYLCTPSNQKSLVVPDALARKFGFITATVLNQLHYWTTKCGKDYHAISEMTVNTERWIPEGEDGQLKDNEEQLNRFKWIYNSLKKWTEQFPGLTLWQIRRALESLRKLGVVIFAQFDKSSFNHCGYYAIDYERLEEFLGISETQSQMDVRPSTHRDETSITSSYITENNSSESNTKNNNSDDVVSAETLSREFKNQEQEEELPQDSHVVEKPKLKSREKQTNPHEDKDYAAAQRDTTSPDTEMNKSLVEGLGVELNPKLKRFLASVTVEELLKGLAGYFHNREYKETKIESITGYLIDSTKNTYIQSLAAWVKADEATKRFVLLTAGALAMGIDLYGGYVGTMQSGKMGFTRHDGMIVPFNFQALQQMVLDKGYTETLKAMWRIYQSAR